MTNTKTRAACGKFEQAAYGNSGSESYEELEPFQVIRSGPHSLHHGYRRERGELRGKIIQAEGEIGRTRQLEWIRRINPRRLFSISSSKKGPTKGTESALQNSNLAGGDSRPGKFIKEFEQRQETLKIERMICPAYVLCRPD
jgi:hypothetical protein